MAAAPPPQVIQLHDPDGGLKSCLTMARVKAELVAFIQDKLGVTSLTDFFYYVTAERWQDELQSSIIKAAAHATVLTESETPIQLSRLRMAWQSANKIMSTTSLTSSAATSDDPLPDSLRALLEQRWRATYPNIELDPTLQPSSALIHRLYNEWQNRRASVTQLSKIRTALSTRYATEATKINLGGHTLTVNASSSAEHATDLTFSSVVQYYLVLRCLTYAWAFIGTEEVQSNKDPTKRVLAMPLGMALDYADYVLRKSVESPAAQSLQWITKNDVLTRGRMVHHQVSGVPPSEALTMALRETVEWSLVPSTAVAGPGDPTLEAHMGETRKRQRAPDATAPPADRRPSVPTISTLKGGRSVCKAWNDDRGCPGTPAGKQCSNGGWHVCDRKLGTRGCGGRHPRKDCPGQS
jgi:hypothetical protein